MNKRLLTACLLPLFLPLIAVAVEQTPKPYENWSADDQEWNTLTNHIMWCYNSLRDRTCVATGSTNLGWEVSLVCPYRDYSLIAQEIDRLAPYFVDHTLAGTNGDFSAYFGATNSTGRCPTEFPRWTPENLHSNAFERTCWSTNSVLTIWMAVTNRAFITEVTDAINMLKKTSHRQKSIFCEEFQGTNCYGWSMEGHFHEYVTNNIAIIDALNFLTADYTNRVLTGEIDPNTGFEDIGTSLFVQNGKVYEYEDDYSYFLCANRRYSYGHGFPSTDLMIGSNPQGNPFAFQPKVSIYLRRTIEWDGYIPSEKIVGRRKVFYCENFGVQSMNEDTTLITYENPIADRYYELDLDLVNYAELDKVWCEFDGYGYGSYREMENTPLILAEWTFSEFPQDALPSASPVETPDVAVDGIVETMPVDGLPGSETGTFVVNPADESPCLYLPLSSDAVWDGQLPVHAYLSQGAVTNLPYHYVPWTPYKGSSSSISLPSKNVPLLSLNLFHYSLNTCVLEEQIVTNEQTHVKQVAVLRPRGEIVVFDFPWNGTATFSTNGYPTGVNRDLGYLLYSSEYNYSLLFPSGIGHKFNHLSINPYWECCLRVFNESYVTRDLFYPFGGSWTQKVACVTGSVYRTTIEWEKGLPTQAKYYSLRTGDLCESVTLGYSDGRAVQLDKSSLEAGAKVQMDNSVLYGTGVKRVRQQTGTHETGRTVTVTTFAGAEATTPYLAETTTFDNRQRLSNRTLAAGVRSVSSGYTYKEQSATDERYPETGLLVRNSVATHTRVGSFGIVTETYNYTPQQGWLSLVSSPQGGEKTNQTVYDYYSMPTNNMRPYYPTLPLRGVFLKSVERKLDGNSYGMVLNSMYGWYFYRAEVDVCHELNAEMGDFENYKYINQIGKSSDSSTGIFRMYESWYKSPSSDIDVYNNGNTLTEAWFSISDESTDKDVFVNAKGVSLYSKTVTWEGATLEETATEVDASGRPKSSTFMDGTTIQYLNYCVHGPQSIINRDGSETTLQYDSFGRVKKRVDGETGITYEYEYDPNNNVTKQTRSVGAKRAESSATYGLDGALLYSKDESGHEITITGQRNNGYLELTRTETGKAAVTNTYWADGTLKSVTGAGASAKIDRDRGVTDNKYWIKTINPDNTSEWSKQWHQYNGLFAYTEQPDGKTSSVAYDDRLRPKSGLSADGVKPLATYDGKYPWLPSVSGVSLTGQDSFNLATDPYCVKYAYDFTAQGLKTTQYSFPDDGSDTPFEEGYTQVSPDGCTGTFSVQGRTGNFSCDAAPATGTYNKTVNLPGGGVATYTYSKFLLRKETMRGAGLALTVTKTYEYDTFNRLEKFTTDERGFKETVKVNRDPTKGLVSSINSSSRGTTSLTRENDLIKQVTTPSGTTKLDWLGNGNLKSVQQDLGPTFSLTQDAFGRDKSITRMNDAQTSELGFTYGNDGGFAGKTRDGAQKISVTSRRADGRSKETVLPDGIIVTTDYDGAGRETGQTWTDPTNASATVAFTYSWMRDGTLRRHAQTGGPYVSNSVTRSDGRIASDTSTFGYGTLGASVQTSYDTTSGNPSLVSAGFAGFTDMNLSTAAAYNNFGYLSALAGAGFTNIFSCSAGGRVINTLSLVGGNVQLSRSVIWSAKTGKPARVDYTLNGQFLRRWQYAFTNGLIASVSRSGGDGYCTAYTYDNARQLRGASSSTTNGTALQGLSFAYEYTLAGDTFNYGRVNWQNIARSTLDDLQTERLWAPYVYLLGRVSASNTVAAFTGVNGSWNRTPVKDGLYYFELYVCNSPDPASGIATVIATPPSGTNDAARVSFSLPASEEHPAYNARGMILSDSRRQYTWDAAERLLGISNSGVSNAVKVAFQYYPDGRRALKTVSCFTNNAWIVTRSLHYVWQGWKLAAECERDNAGTVTAVRHFVWGPDIAGQQSASLESGAEGVGGLLLIREWKPGRGIKQYLPLTDGMGSVCGLIDATDGSLAAEYDYDPYGGPVIERGVASDACPFRHRTRYYDAETWLYYYGYRYYDPSTTKWISKDPLGEEGGWNLTCFCGNDPVNGFDPTGLQTAVVPGGASLPVRYGASSSLPSQSLSAQTARANAARYRSELIEYFNRISPSTYNAGAGFRGPQRYYDPMVLSSLQSLAEDATGLVKKYERNVYLPANQTDRDRVSLQLDNEFINQAGALVDLLNNLASSLNNRWKLDIPTGKLQDGDMSNNSSHVLNLNNQGDLVLYGLSLDNASFLKNALESFKNDSVFTSIVRVRGDFVIQRSDIPLSLKNVRLMNKGNAPFVLDSHGKWNQVQLHHVGREDGKFVEVMKGYHQYYGPLHIPGPGSPMRDSTFNEHYWKQRLQDFIDAGLISNVILEKTGR